MGKSIFLSHSHADQEIARRLARDLRAAGVTVWLDEAELEVADSLVDKIGQAIDAADFLGVLLSRDSVRSTWVSREVEIALIRDIAKKTDTVLPLLITDCEVPPFLRGKVYADFRDAAGYDQEFSKLRKRLGAAEQESSGTKTIFFDESYKQGRWHAQPVIDAGYSTVAQVTAKDYTVVANSSGYADPDVLRPKTILIVPAPFGSLVEDQQYENIARWVHRGGRVLLLGNYLMEAHHYTNFNSLSRRLGFKFCQNLTMPVGHESRRECDGQAFAYNNRDYWIETAPIGEPASHPLLKGIAKLAITSACTLEAVEADLRVSTFDPVAVLHALSWENPQGGRLKLMDYVLDKRERALFLVAFRHGMGRVVGVGTWKAFLNELVNADNDNLSLWRNIVAWLGEDGDRQQQAARLSPGPAPVER
ncbi:MAG TPA: TIR domain-containing protein [Candidatus Methylomirabilis sp.]|nr:TIR domain-containing protein [Candidatus Methylomirabilis sp.]